MEDNEKTKIELFKTVATFGFLAAAMFCLGGPLILAFAPGVSPRFRCWMIVLSGAAGFLIVMSVLYFYCRLVRARPWPGERGQQEPKVAVGQATKSPIPSLPPAAKAPEDV